MDNRKKLDHKNEHFSKYIKTQLVNSRFLLEDNFQLELHLYLSYYLLKEN